MDYRALFIYLLISIFSVSCESGQGQSQTGNKEVVKGNSQLDSLLRVVYLHSSTYAKLQDTIEFSTEPTPIGVLDLLNDYYKPSSDRKYTESEISIDTTLANDIRMIEMHKYTHGYLAFVHPDIGAVRIDRIWDYPEYFELLSFSTLGQDSLELIKKEVMSLRKSWIKDRSKFTQD